MTVIWPQSGMHYWIGVGVWLIAGVLVSSFLVRGWHDRDRDDCLLVCAIVTPIIAFGWPLEQFIVYFVVVCAAIGWTISAIANRGTR
jgi:uncharacterized membrane protein YhaH (DUF805 family)